MTRQRGFTLLEVLIAVTITAVIGLGVWQVLSGVVAARDRVNELAEDFDGLQRAMLLLERDLIQIVNRPARDIYGDFQPALTSRDEAFALMLTRQGWRNPLGIRRSGLQRVAWEYTGTELRDGVIAFEVRFLNDERAWQPEWPTDSALASLNPGSRPDIPLPLGIEVTLEHERFGELVRTFTLPDFDAAQAQGTVNQFNAANTSDDTSEAQEETTSPGQTVPGQGG